MDIEQKVDLIQQVHREQAESERNFYRKYNWKGSVYHDSGVSEKYLFKENETASWVASFRLRLLLAVVFFMCFFVMEKKEIVLEGIGYTEIVESISSNFSIENWESDYRAAP